MNGNSSGRRTVILSGGVIEPDFVLPILKSEQTELIIAVDRGLCFLYEHGIRPDYIVGDFDSVDPDVVHYYKTQTNVPIKEFNPVKDSSDTEIALRLCFGLRRKEIWLLGATGARLDHFWANVQCLKLALDAGVRAYIVDSCNRISLHDDEFALRRDGAFGTCFSIFSLGAAVEGLSIEGAKYPLRMHTLFPHNSLCVSNEWAADTVRIRFSYGTVVLMETRDPEKTDV